MRFPYASLSRIGHFYVDDYNKGYQRNIDNQEMVFPFQIDQTIINGKRFFEMIEHYKGLVEDIKSLSIKDKETASDANEILETLNKYKGQHRKGDVYIRVLFNCALIYYVDRFGRRDLPRAIQKLFIWAYSLRLESRAVRIESIDNHALENHQIFKAIREALSPNSVLNLPLKSLEENTVINNLEDVVKLFKDMNYYA